MADWREKKNLTVIMRDQTWALSLGRKKDTKPEVTNSELQSHR